MTALASLQARRRRRLRLAHRCPACHHLTLHLDLAARDGSGPVPVLCPCGHRAEAVLP
ncbi:hypothetical protein [Vallicoccus soli]|uniref:hypothetical protein n=1 Tax=Vallicoccus soli TaxID=2339232 RepID=UPI00140413E8|nr:hypothetical protein [Vallicoccus soli]